MKITVSGSEQITVGAGTFQTVVLKKDLTITEGGSSYSYSTTEWYAEGVGLVKMSSPNMSRELVSYNVKTVQTSDFQILGNTGSFSNLQEVLDVARNGNIIQIKNATVYGHFSQHNPTSLIINGGYDNSFNTIVGKATINGSLTIEKGQLTVSKLEII